MAAELPPKRSSSQSSRFKSAATTVVAAGRLRKTVGSATNMAAIDPVAPKQVFSSRAPGAASVMLADPSSSTNSSATSSKTKRSIHEASSSSSESGTSTGSTVDSINCTSAAKDGAEVSSASAAKNRTSSLSTDAQPLVQTEDRIRETSSSTMETDGSVSTPLVSGTNSAGPGEVADVYDEETPWFVPANTTKLHTGSKLFWRIKRTIHFKLYVSDVGGAVVVRTYDFEKQREFPAIVMDRRLITAEIDELESAGAKIMLKANTPAVLEDEKITAFVISRIEAEKDGATNDVKVKIAKRPLDSYESLDFSAGKMPVGVENIGRGAKWIKTEQS